MDATRTEQGMSDDGLHVMLHALGLSDPFQVESYRNHFVAGDGHADMAVIRRLCEAGLMEELTPPRFLEQGDRVYLVTERGKGMAMRRRPRRSRAQRRYHRWLSVSDCFPGLTFREFLTNPEFADCRE